MSNLGEWLYVFHDDMTASYLVYTDDFAVYMMYMCLFPGSSGTSAGLVAIWDEMLYFPYSVAFIRATHPKVYNSHLSVDNCRLFHSFSYPFPLHLARSTHPHTEIWAPGE